MTWHPPSGTRWMSAADRRFNVIIDALDEAANPAQARAIIEGVVLPLVETCSAVGAQVVVGTRRRDDGGDLLGLFGGALSAIDLDEREYFAEEDLAEYAMACTEARRRRAAGQPLRRRRACCPARQHRSPRCPSGTSWLPA